MMQTFEHISKVKGELNLPGDKSISHRAVMFSCLAEGTSQIENLSDSEDVKSTISCFKQLGCNIFSGPDKIIVEGKGYKKLEKPSAELYAGNSGTTARLISGILSAQNFVSVITGDKSLSKRPMLRIVEPLKQMGANIEASRDGTLPIKIFPSGSLHHIKYKLPVPSAQVKSAILLAGLHLNEKTEVIEEIPSRNHTEKLLNLEVEKRNGENIIRVSRANYPVAAKYFVPSDISTAAFFIVLTLLIKNSELKINNVSLNETRSGIIKILKSMGADISITGIKQSNNEPFGDVIVKSSNLQNVEIPEDVIPNIIDEIPILSLAGLFAEGNFRINNCKELRYKESDRIKALCENYKRLGIEVNEFEDGFELIGRPQLKRTVFESYGDHRIAMTFAVASLLLEEGGAVENFECVKISNPGFIEQLQRIAK